MAGGGERRAGRQSSPAAATFSRGRARGLHPHTLHAASRPHTHVHAPACLAWGARPPVRLHAPTMLANIPMAGCTHPLSAPCTDATPVHVAQAAGLWHQVARNATAAAKWRVQHMPTHAHAHHSKAPGSAPPLRRRALAGRRRLAAPQPQGSCRRGRRAWRQGRWLPARHARHCCREKLPPRRPSMLPFLESRLCLDPPAPPPSRLACKRGRRGGGR